MNDEWTGSVWNGSRVPQRIQLLIKEKIRAIEASTDILATNKAEWSGSSGLPAVSAVCSVCRHDGWLRRRIPSTTMRLCWVYMEGSQCNWRIPELLSGRAREVETPACGRSSYDSWLIIIMALSAILTHLGWLGHSNMLYTYILYTQTNRMVNTRSHLHSHTNISSSHWASFPSAVLEQWIWDFDKKQSITEKCRLPLEEADRGELEREEKAR